MPSWMPLIGTPFATAVAWYAAWGAASAADPYGGQGDTDFSWLPPVVTVFGGGSYLMIAGLLLIIRAYVGMDQTASPRARTRFIAIAIVINLACIALIFGVVGFNSPKNGWPSDTASIRALWIGAFVSTLPLWGWVFAEIMWRRARTFRAEMGASGSRWVEVRPGSWSTDHQPSLVRGAAGTEQAPPSPATRLVVERRVEVLSDGQKAALAGADVPTEVGWYPDPLSARFFRYWNGQQWTGRLGTVD